MNVLSFVSLLGIYLFLTPPVYAASNADVISFSNQTFQVLIILSSLFATVFLIKGGYTYITSSGKPDALESAKKIIRNALIGLLLILSASIFSSILSQSFTSPSQVTTENQLVLKQITPVTEQNGVTRIFTDAAIAFMQNIVLSATKPLLDAIIFFLTQTPQLSQNSVVFNFWLVILGITDSLYALAIALLGFHIMSSSSFGFDEIELKQLLPRIGLSFLAANSSIFLADWVIALCNTLVQALLKATGGLTGAWILNADQMLSSDHMILINLIFLLLFVVLTVVLLLFYISRLIALVVGAVLSPLIFLLWTLPKFSDFAEVSVKSYLVTVFSVFIHVVIIQLGSAFLTIPGQAGTNTLLSVLIGIGILLTLLKTQSFFTRILYYSAGGGVARKVGGQILNVLIHEKTMQNYSFSTAKK